MPTIRISEDSLERLKEWAEPLEDTADSALEKALDAAKAHRDALVCTTSRLDPASTPRSLQNPPAAPAPRPGNRRSRKLRWQEFQRPLLLAIHSLGGRASREQVLAAVRPLIEDKLLPGDLELGKSGKERWRLTARDTRPRLIEAGYLRNDSRRGVWALSDEGIKLVESWIAETPGNFVDHLRAMPDAGEDSDFER